MGLSHSSWSNKEAETYAAFLIDIFGKPWMTINKAGGMTIWRTAQLSKKKLFGSPVCFNQIVVADTDLVHHFPKDHYDFLSMTIKVPITSVQQCMLESGIDVLTYNQQFKCLSVRCNDMGKIISVMALVTGILTKRLIVTDLVAAYKSSIMEVLDESSPTKLNMDLIKAKYSDLYADWAILNEVEKPAPVTPVTPAREHWVDDPWYGEANPGEPYVTYYPGNLAMVEDSDKAYYDNLDAYERKKGISVFSQAPSGKPSLENLINFPRYGKNGPYERFTAYDAFKGYPEKLISFPVVDAQGNVINTSEAFSNGGVMKKIFTGSQWGSEPLKPAPSCKGACARRVADYNASKKEHYIPGTINNATNNRYAKYNATIQEVSTVQPKDVEPVMLEHLRNKKKH